MKNSYSHLFKYFVLTFAICIFFQDSKADLKKVKAKYIPTIEFSGNPKITKDCTFNGMKLYGKIKFVEAFPDIKVQIVEAFPDINVQIVNAFPDQCGRWQIVEAFPDLKVQIVEAFPDIRVKYVNSFPGINK
ncbi:MAG: hypothetical protein WCK02_12710 [Bacteroidota bacterium]